MVLTKRQQSNMVRLTETNLPTHHKTDKNPDTKRAWRENYPGGEVAHHWARNTIPHGRCGNLFFASGVIYSYGRHFPIARHIKVKKTGDTLILFTTRDYSSTTSGHKHEVRGAIQRNRDGRMMNVFWVPKVMADTRTDHRENLEHFRQKAIASYDQSLTATRNSPGLLRQTLEHIHDGNRYAEAVGLTDRIGSLLGGDLPSFEERVRREIEAAEAKQEAIDAGAEERFKVRNAARMAAYEKELEEWQVKLKEWHDCLRNEFPEKPVKPRPGTRRLHCWDRDNTTYVRVSRDKFLQTSKGMTIPLNQVLPILAAIRKGDPANPVGGFEVDVRGSKWSGQILWMDKTFQIGCHTVTFAEIERAAQAAGL